MTVDIIQIDEDNRLVVDYDQWAEDPREWGWGVELCEIKHGYDYFVENTEYDEAIAMLNEVWDRTGEFDKAFRAMKLWMILTGDKRIAKLVHIQQYRDRYDFVALGYEENEIDSFMEVFQQWSNGEVYTVSHEQRLEYVLRKGDKIILEDVHEEWEMVDSIGGNYLDHEHTAIEVARDYFDIDHQGAVCVHD